MENENRGWRNFWTVVAVLAALAAVLFVVIRMEKRIRQLCYQLERRLGLKKNAEFRVDFDEV